MSKDRSRSIKNLQEALAMELAAVQQYLLHAHVLDDWGLDRLAAQMREEMQEELGHAGAFIDRILFLGGEPRVGAQRPARRAASLEALFGADLEEEKAAVAFYTAAANDAASDSDIGTRTLFERIALDEEGHMAWLSLQLDLLGRMGEPAFIARHISVPGEAT